MNVKIAKLRIFMVSTIMLLIVFGFLISEYNKEKDIENSIEYMATVDKIFILQDDDHFHSKDNVYIVDTNRHILEFDFNPDLLLLHEGDSILVYVSPKDKDDDIFHIKRYKQFGFVDPNKISETVEE